MELRGLKIYFNRSYYVPTCDMHNKAVVVVTKINVRHTLFVARTCGIPSPVVLNYLIYSSYNNKIGVMYIKHSVLFRIQSKYFLCK